MTTAAHLAFLEANGFAFKHSLEQRCQEVKF